MKPLSVKMTFRRPGAKPRAAATRRIRTAYKPYYVVQESYSDGKFDRVSVFADPTAAIARYEEKVKEHRGLGLRETGGSHGNLLPDGTLFCQADFEANDGTDIRFRVMDARDGEVL